MLHIVNQNLVAPLSKTSPTHPHQKELPFEKSDSTLLTLGHLLQSLVLFLCYVVIYAQVSPFPGPLHHLSRVAQHLGQTKCYIHVCDIGLNRGWLKGGEIG